jgi:hypothetical protein
VSAALRQDLGMLDVLKVYPLHGWKLVLGELMGPALVVSFFQALLALVAVVTIAPIGENSPVPLFLGASAALTALLIVLPLNFVSAIVPSAATLLFPAWAKPGKEVHQPGFEAVGQRMIFGLAQLAALLVALAPAAGVGLLVFFAGRWVAGTELGLIAAGILAGAILAVEAAFGVRLLGRLYDGYDASAEQ